MTAEIQAARQVIDQIMEQAQVFASAWSLVDSQFDSGDMLDDAKKEKEDLRELVIGSMAAEVASRQAAQIENEELKARIAHTGVELRQAVAAERDACIRLCLSEQKNPFSRDHNNGLQHAADAMRFCINAKES
jgi:hypothetical protein